MNKIIENRLNACLIDRSVSLVAPAGSGKTTVLVNRFLTLAAFGVAIRSIIIITYTDNAASSIKERIITTARDVYYDYLALSKEERDDKYCTLKLIFNRKLSADRNVDLSSFLKENFALESNGRLLKPDELYLLILNNLTDIKISTFHGFFSGVIGAFPFETGLFPGFSIMDNNESKIILDELIEEFFITHSASSINYNNPDIPDISGINDINSGAMPAVPGNAGDSGGGDIKKRSGTDKSVRKAVNYAGQAAGIENKGEDEQAGMDETMIDFFYILNNKAVWNSRNETFSIESIEILKKALVKFDLVILSIDSYIESHINGIMNNSHNLEYTDILDYDLRRILDSGIIEYLFNITDIDVLNKFNEIKSIILKNSPAGIEDYLYNSYEFIIEGKNKEEKNKVDLNLKELIQQIINFSGRQEVKNSWTELIKHNRLGLLFDEKKATGTNGDIRLLNDFSYDTKKALKDFEKYISRNKKMPVLTDAQINLLSLLEASHNDYFEKVNLLSYIGLILSMFKIIKAYEGKKRSKNKIDFSDIELKALNLLNNIDFQYAEEKLNYKINHLIIDEFQDVNRVEFELIKKIMEESLSGYGIVESKRIKNTIFFVGDPNQSIYGFRSSDYRIFYEAVSYFKSKVSENFRFDELSLNENFRSSAKLIESQNRCFSHPLFESLTNAKNVVSANYEFKKADFPSIIFREFKKGNVNKSKKEQDNAEHVIIASAIKELMDCYCQSGSGSGSSFRASSIKIISRTRTKWDDLKNALINLNIPFKFYGDRSFYTKREIELACSGLKFLLNPDDDLPVMIILSSKLFNFTHFSGFFLETGITSNNPSIIEKLKDLYPEVYNKLINFRKRAVNLSPYDALKELYLMFDVESIYSADPQELANLDKLSSLALKYEGKTIYEFLSDISASMVFGSEEAEEEVSGNTEYEEDKVAVMTIHGAKGLESDIVFLYNTPLKDKEGNKKAGDFGFDIIFDGRKPEFIFFNGYYQALNFFNVSKSGFFSEKIKKFKNKAGSEFIRLIYVVLTRPKLLCFITGEEKSKNSKQDTLPSWNDFFDDVNSIKNDEDKVAEDICLICSENQNKDQNLEIGWLFKKVVELVPKRHNGKTGTDNGINGIIEINNSPANFAGFKSILQYSPVAGTKKNIISAMSETEPLHSVSRGSGDFGSSAGGNFSMLKGTIIHEILKRPERIPILAEGPKTALVKTASVSVKELIFKLLKNLDNAVLSKSDIKLLEKEVKEFIVKIDKLKYRDIIYKGFNEIPYLKSFNLDFDGFVVSGIVESGRIDKIVFVNKNKNQDSTANGINIEGIEVYDYKTGGYKEHDLSYGDQINSYCNALEEIFNGKEIRGFLYFIEDDILILEKVRGKSQ